MGRGRKGKESSKRTREGAKLAIGTWRKDAWSDAGAAVAQRQKQGQEEANNRAEVRATEIQGGNAKSPK